MSAVSHYFCSSIGRKHLIAFTGLSLCLFLVSHLAGNLLLLVGPDAFNYYAYKLTSNPLIYVAEAGLLVIFLIHFGLAVKLTIENKQARGKRYLKKTRTGRGATFMSETMPYTGFILLIFIILHLIQLKFGAHYETSVDGVQMRDLYRLVLEYFSSPIAAAWYVIAMIAAGLHTAHGFSSAFQSFGLNHPRYFKKIQCISYIYAIVIAVGFSFLAVWAHLKGA